jgi:S-(hydroxymethyl)glutathione dehydrogenase / alcohol dehydrogenase
VGLNSVSRARIAGASRIIVIAIQAKRLERGPTIGLTDIIDATKREPVEASAMFFLKDLITCLISLG